MQVNSTLTPEDEEAGAPDDPRGPLPVLRILFHPELDRIGATTDPGLFFPDQPLTIGRVTPSFSSRAGQVEPLTDPCVSREQLRITWTHRCRWSCCGGCWSFTGRATCATCATWWSGSLEGIDDRKLLALLEEHDYVQSRVAQAVGVSHTTIDRRMRKLGLRRPRDLSQQKLEDAAQQTGSDLAAMARLLKVSRRGLKLRAAALGIALEG
jgi:Bacterial regulatory protein, Fis family